jgi:hydroxyethylthiazole kinase-like uncharacterized protein yjeF
LADREGRCSVKLVTVEEMRAIEKQTDAAGITYDQMMERAGRGVAEAVEEWINPDGRSVVVLVGPGNNGGDGLVAGRYLAQRGAHVTFYLYKAREAKDKNVIQAKELDLPVLLAGDDKEGAKLQELVLSADVIVDALLGTGITLPIRGGLKNLLEGAGKALGENRKRRREREDEGQNLMLPVESTWYSNDLPLVVAVDCPSGLDCNSGEIDPVAISADLTVTFAAPKVGQITFPGAEAIGELYVADIGCPPDLPALQEVSLELATANEVRALLPVRSLDSHKGTFGKAMIVAGSINYIGAAALAADAAYRAGAGLVTLAVPSAIQMPLAAHLTETTYVLLPHTMGAINEHAVDLLLESVEGYSALLVGPGLGRDEQTRLFLERLLARKRPMGREEQNESDENSLPPMVVDADALNLLSETKDWPRFLPPNCVLTPHPGEMSRLSGLGIAEIQADRIGIAHERAVDWKQIVILKGAYTVVAAPDDRVTVIPFANPALATAGTGDVLAGTVVSLLAQGIAPFEAAVAGAFIHGSAGEMAGEELGRAGTMSGDLLPYIAAVLEEWGL